MPSYPWFPALAAAGAFCSLDAAAQEVLAPPPFDYTGGASIPRAAISTNQLGPLSPAMATAIAIAKEPPLWQWGPFDLRTRLLYRFTYGDGVPAAPGQNYTTIIDELRPGVLFDLGDHWTLDYSPTLRFYSNRNFRDTTDHSVTLKGATTYQDWTLTISQHYATISQPLYETSAQTDQEIYSTAAEAIYHFNSRLSLDLGLNQNFRLVDQTQANQSQANQALTDSRQWSTMDWLGYQFWPRFSAGLGAGLGYINLSRGPDMSFEQIQGRINWQATEKVSLTMSFGLEDLQFLGSQAPNLLDPIFAASALYRPLQATTLSLNASRTFLPSLYSGLIIDEITVSAEVSQTLFHKLVLDVAAGYNTLAYDLTTTGLNLSRNDDYRFANARLSVPFLKRGTAALFYRYLDYSSTSRAYARSSTQGGFELGYRF